MVKVTKNENVRIVYRPYLRQEWIGLRQTNTKMIKVTDCTHMVEYISATETHQF